ncbi:enamine deaminase RidA (YjgF/YER057c/UK114 family) [Scopulibacillus darangshiensis]|uniref:Enamine deaminase RidA (YjgF/YER057c/UK114 family) n=1 Tax=Scopulibacillus darangshiensis TaxID=442528 RepID=A0A4R2P3Z6_9BACL|nr:RidA family protein [Scopulibacillus darangshiensis]TCP29442.1 enamine deaminase RidA (YjgF/YER057c/UK114 family) [Scopulibacillus darangshiensis]
MQIKRFRKFETKNFYPSDLGEAEHHIKNELSMAVRAGNRIFLRGQTGFDLEGNFHGKGDVAKQTDMACRCVKQLLEEAGGSVNDICKMTVYLTDRSYRSSAYAVIAEHFRGVYPCSTGLVVNGLAMPEMLMEIDVEAIVSNRIND